MNEKMNNKKCKGYFRIGVTSNNNDFSQNYLIYGAKY